ncbi:acyclic terpene utilization AtuA family protein [Rhodococcus sp. OK302]|uniref:acyclic terpene utilization AtuA family protein n=1 Tax=Rhodococcus sp. OK302 TaxID=1882769 RepID=UPI000B94105C|nr:acyclic terpene utilization AtuA family protein [Rhodococcus sp. OK302]OYD66517.1 uncharacterized protein DUF1446 [Rhodococcus sp. OK302]
MTESAVHRRPVRIGNVSGFYGDRFDAFKEMVEGSLADPAGVVDVVTGDYLAELTMLILWKSKKKDPSTGYAKTFLEQFRAVVNTCADKGIKVVVNAGGLNPAGLAEQIRAVAADAGVNLSVAHIEGDDLRPRLEVLQAAGHQFRHLDKDITLAESGADPVSANAYLGGWGIASALQRGADVVICPRVTDAALVVGVGAWWHGWDRTDFDALAGAVAAGHVIECGPQACGGNYSQIAEIVDRRYPGSPIAELAHDGSFVITKLDGTGGLVSPGTVTAQLLYEVDAPAYLNPDVIAHFDTLTITSEGDNRVRVCGTRGSAPPPTLKVAMNYIGGYRNTMTLVLTGLDIAEKAQWAQEELFEILGGRDAFDETDVQLLRYDVEDPSTMAQAVAHLRVTVKDRDRTKVDRAFSNAVVELSLAGYAGFHTTTPPSSASEFGVYWPALIPADEVEQVVCHADGTRETIPHSALVAESTQQIDTNESVAATLPRVTSRRALGTVAAARSGDKGGKANVGVWTDTAERWDWLRAHLTVDQFRKLVPEAEGLVVHRYEFPNLRALNFVVVGFLGDGVASSTRSDPQAKGLGEYLRARHTDIPDELIG